MPTILLSNDRRALKRQHAEALRFMENYREVRERVKHFENLKDQAAEQHRQVTEPIQQQLRESDERSVAAIVDRKPVDPQEELLRQRLMAELEAANCALQSAIRDADDRLIPHAKKLIEMSRDMPSPSVIESRLYDCGDPVKWGRCEALKWIDEQLRHVKKSAVQNQEKCVAYSQQANRDGVPDQVELADRRSKQWGATIEVISEFADEVRNEAVTLRQEIIDE